MAIRANFHASEKHSNSTAVLKHHTFFFFFCRKSHMIKSLGLWDTDTENNYKQISLRQRFDDLCTPYLRHLVLTKSDSSR